MSATYHVILTGGVGSRLWPLSRKSQPKQYLEIFKNDSLFELAIKRNQKFSDGLIVVGNKDNRSLSISSLKKLGINSYYEIVEATPRNTAPAIAFAAFQVKSDDILVVTPADHIIKADENYDHAVSKAIKLAEEGNIVTFGVKPKLQKIFCIEAIFYGIAECFVLKLVFFFLSWKNMNPKSMKPQRKLSRNRKKVD